MSRWRDTVKQKDIAGGGDIKSHPGALDEILPAPIDVVGSCSSKPDLQSVMEEGRQSVPKTRSIAGVSRSYLKKITSYFIQNSTIGKSSRKNPFTPEEKFTVKTEGDNLSSDGSTKELCSLADSPKVVQKTENTGSGGQRSTDQSETAPAAGTTPNAEYNAFLLPRVFLKQQDSGVAMRRSSNSGSEKGYSSKSGHERISSSHYSTDKSGSSGYYSSNLYSTGSVDEHIYSEPVIDAIEASSVAGKMLTPKIVEKQKTKPCTYADNDDEDDDDDGSKIHQAITYDYDHQHYGAPLERRLSLEYTKRTTTQKLPTIMEGIDGQIPRPIWPSDMDDSLVDINLDSFLLNKDQKNVHDEDSSGDGVVNPALDCDDLSESNSLENNYRCAKYVNSCPENPYCVEGVLEDIQSSVDKSLSLYLQKCEDSITIQTTREFLEEIRKKLNSLLEEHYDENGDPLTTTTPQTRSTILRTDDNRQSRRKTPAVIKDDIKNLKRDLDDYLKVMNQTNELEIQQLCTGIARDARLTTMKNALENRMRNSENERRLGSLVMRNFAKSPQSFPSSSGQRSLTFYDEDLIHQSEDPNFQLKRKTSPCSSDCGQMVPEFVVDSEVTVHHQSSGSQMHQNIAAMHPAPLLLPKISKSPTTEQDMILEWHRNKPSIWEQYYGVNRPDQPILVRKSKITSTSGKKKPISVVSYPSTRPESDFTLDLPRAQQLERKLKEQKRFRSRCKIFAFLLSFFFFLVTVMVVSLVLTRGKRMFGSML